MESDHIPIDSKYRMQTYSNDVSDLISVEFRYSTSKHELIAVFWRKAEFNTYIDFSSVGDHYLL